MAETLPDRTALAARVVAYRRERGAALLDGKPFDDTALVEAERALVALEDVEAARARRAADVSASNEERRVASLRGEVAQRYQEFQKQGALAEHALADLVAAIRGMKTAGAQIVKAANSIAAGTAPMAFESSAIDDRITRFMCWQFSKLSGSSRFGLFELRMSVEGPTDFATMENRATAAAIDAIVNPVPTNTLTPAPLPELIEEQEFESL